MAPIYPVSVALGLGAIPQFLPERTNPELPCPTSQLQEWTPNGTFQVGPILGPLLKRHVTCLPASSFYATGQTPGFCENDSPLPGALLQHDRYSALEGERWKGLAHSLFPSVPPPLYFHQSDFNMFN